MRIEAKQYGALKQASAIDAIKITEETFAFRIKQFNEFTGEAKTDAVEQVNLPELKAQRAALAENLAGLDAIIADLEATK